MLFFGGYLNLKVLQVISFAVFCSSIIFFLLGRLPIYFSNASLLKLTSLCPRVGLFPLQSSPIFVNARWGDLKPEVKNSTEYNRSFGWKYM
jgi:hypothetical protein